MSNEKLGDEVVEENEEEVEEEEEGEAKMKKLPGRSPVSCGLHLAILLATQLSET